MNFYKSGKYVNAVESAQKAVELATPNSEDWVLSLHHLALAYQGMGDYDKAEPLLEQCLQARNQYLPDNYLGLAQSLSSLANLYQNKGEYAKALPLAIRALDIRKSVLGKKHPGYAQSLTLLGLVHQKMGDYKKSLSLFEQARDIFKTTVGERHISYAITLNQIAALYRSMGDYNKAIPLIIAAINVRNHLPNKNQPDFADFLENLAGLYEDMSDYQKAGNSYEQALQIRKAVQGEEHPSYNTLLTRLAEIHQKNGQYAKALPLLEQAYQSSKQTLTEDHPTTAAIAVQLADILRIQGNYERALSLYEQSFSVQKIKLGEKHPQFAALLNNMGSLYRIKGAYSKAVPMLQQGLSIRKATVGKNHIDYATSLYQLALLYVDMAAYAKALLSVKEAIAIHEKVMGKNSPLYANMLSCMAGVYYKQGLLTQAALLYEQTAALQRRLLGEQHPDYANSLQQLGELYMNLWDYKKALYNYQQAAAIKKAILGEKNPQYLAVLYAIAQVYQRQNDPEAAKLHLHVWHTRKEVLGENHPDYARSLMQAATLYEAYGELVKADEMLQSALQIQKKSLGENHPDIANLLVRSAALKGKLKDYTKAQAFYRQAGSIYKATIGENHADYARFLSQMAETYLHQEVPQKAEPLLFQSHDIIYKQISELSHLLSERERENLLATVADEFEKFNSFTLKRKKANPAISGRMYDNALLLKGLLLQSAIQLRLNILATNDEKLLRTMEAWEAAKQQWLEMLNAAEPDIDAIDNLDFKINELEKQLAAKVTDNHLKIIRWQQVQQALQPQEAAVEIVRFRVYDKQWKDTVRYAALVLTPQLKQPQVVVLPHGKLMEARGTQGYRAAVATLRGVGVETEEDNIMPADSLYQLFWQPIQQTLDSLGTFRTVYLSPDGVYHQVNLLTLPHPKGGYIADALDLRLVGSTRDVVKRRRVQGKPQPAALFGFPDYLAAPQAAPEAPLVAATASGYATYRALERTGNISPLPGTQAEVGNISRIMQQQSVPHQVWQGAQASEAQLRQLVSPQVLHIATHGFFEAVAESDTKPDRLSMSGISGERAFENPYLRCGLYLAGAETSLKNREQLPAGTNDGILTAYEAAGLRLDGTELVVLSACETGLGISKNGEGVYGLHRAFQTAGAQTVIYSLWKVADEQTQELMSDFYRRWLAEKKPKRQAFAEAQAALRKKHPEPYFWGAFVLVGE
ncbi:tetratricopeptide repeat protein [Rhodoflexus sp.]